MPVPKIPPEGASPIRRDEGIADPRYLLGEIEEMKAIADKAGFRLLAHLLYCAATEARALAGEVDERRGGTS